MIDIYVLNKDLEQIGIIDNYTSLIWASRYLEDGDCELYIGATNEMLSLLRKDHFLTRHDDDMICRIESIELDTNIEDGNYLIIKGYDVKKILSQRIVWTQTNIDGNVESYIRKLVNDSLINPNLSYRAITDSTGRKNFFLSNVKGFKEVITQQVTYAQVAEKIKELCNYYGWGYRIYVENKNFYFDLYKGIDRTGTVIFSPDLENLIATKYKEDSSNIANVALIGGEGEGSERTNNTSGHAEGIDRSEIFVDAKDISKTIKWEDLKLLYPTGIISGTTYVMNQLDIQIIDDYQLADLKINFPNGIEITKDNVKYYRITNIVIADLNSSTPENNDDVILRNVIYSVYLLNRGYEKLSEYGSIITFEGSIEADTTFKYKEDYFLGDLVTIENEYGISIDARIVEVIEIYDENGKSIEPKFEYPHIDNLNYLLTEIEDKILTENNEFILLEGDL